MSKISVTYTDTKTSGSNTIRGISTFTSTYSVTETDDRVIISNDGTSYTGPTFVGTTGSAAEDFIFRIRVENACGELCYLAVNGERLLNYESVTIPKTHAVQNVTISLYSETVNIAANPKTSYAITLLRQDDSVVQTLTKWYNEDLKLPSISAENYTFIGWATTVAKSITGEVDYEVGDLYINNESASLYSSHELTYHKPIIDKLKIERCDVDGTLNDEGTYALVVFDIDIFVSSLPRYIGGDTYPYSQNDGNLRITVGEHSSTSSSVSPSGSYVAIVGDGDYDVDFQYDAVVEMSDTQRVKSDNLTTAYAILTNSFFPIDFNADSSAMGIFMSAPDNKEGLYIGKDLFLPLNTTALPTTTDGKIYQALVSFNWIDVIV